MISGIIDNWGFDVLDEETKQCINGEIYDSTKFTNGKVINTSIIKRTYLLNNYLAEDLHLIPNVMVETINNSKYILGSPTNTFKNSKGIVNIIKLYLNRT